MVVDEAPYGAAVLPQHQLRSHEATNEIIIQQRHPIPYSVSHALRLKIASFIVGPRRRSGAGQCHQRIIYSDLVPP